MNKYLFCLIVPLLLSCNQTNEVYMHDVGGNWAKKNQQVFTFDVKDVQEPKNIIFVVRNNNQYPYSNIRLFCNLLRERQKSGTTDTLNYLMAKPNGEWLGNGFGETKEIHFQYKNQYRFSTPGKYTIKISQAMRKDPLPGIEDFGIRIEPSNNLK